jgi:putative transport protein
MVRKGGRNIVATDDTILENGDAVLVVAEDNEAIATAAAKLGKSHQPLASDRADLDYVRVFVGKASAVGIPLAQLPMPLAIRPICCTFVAMTPTWSLRPT